MTTSYRINPDQVAFEIFDNDEVLVINLDTGTYYSLTGSSSRLWAVLASGAPAEYMIADQIRRHDHDPDLMAGAVNEFLARLAAENLVVQDAAIGAFTPQAELDIPPESRTLFSGFEMRIFTDMQDLLLLDPIHDVEEAGWPLAKPVSPDCTGT